MVSRLQGLAAPRWYRQMRMALPPRRPIGAGWRPPYALPLAAGDVVHVSPGGNTFNSIRPGGSSGADWTRVNFGVFGSGFWHSTCDRLGCYFVGGGNGGHDDGINLNGAGWFVRTGAWGLLTPTNTGMPTTFANGTGVNTLSADTNGAPYFSINGTTPSASVPAGSHAYRNQVPYDDGTQYGRAYWVHRGGATRSGSKAEAAHRITLGASSITYAQAASCPTSRGTDDDCVVVVGGVAYRITSSNHSYTSLETFTFATETYSTTSTYSAPSASCSGNGCAWRHANRYIVKRGSSNTYWIFDTQTPGDGWVQLTTSGTPPTSVVDLPAEYGSGYYWVPKAGGTTLEKVTAPSDPVGGTWAFGTASVSTSLPAHPTTGEAYSSAFGLSILGLQYIGWAVGGDYGMHLMLPNG